METLPLGLQSWERTIRAVDLVKNRLLRATAALETAGIAYAVIGGNAVAARVGRVDESAVRFTQDVDLLVRRSDFDVAKAVLETAGFTHRELAFVKAAQHDATVFRPKITGHVEVITHKPWQ